MSVIPIIDKKEYTDSDQDLILFLNLDKEIIQCNEESKRLTGFTRDEMIHKKFIEIMVPAESTRQWRDLLDSIQHTTWIENFVLPLKTKDDQIRTITWTGFLVKDENGTVKNICIFGKPLQTEAVSSQSLEIFTPKVASSKGDVVSPEFEVVSKEVSEEPVVQSVEEEVSPVAASSSGDDVSLPEFEVVSKEVSEEPVVQSVEEEVSPVAASSTEGVDLPESGVVISKDSSEKTPEQKDKEMIMKHRVKKLLFASKKRNEEPTTDAVQEQVITPLVSMAKLLETTSQKLDFINEILKELSQKYEMITTRVTELEKKDRRWEKKHHTMQKSQPPLEEPVVEQANQQLLKEEQEQNPDATVSVEEPPKNEKISFFSDPFGFKRQHQELDIKTQQLEDPFGFKRQHQELDIKTQQLELRLKEFEASEAQFQKEQHIFNARLQEFSKWQEKLKLLESEIENRRQELLRQEDMLLAHHTVSLPSNETYLSDLATGLQ